MLTEETAANLAMQFESLPERLGGHIFLSLVALVIGILLSIPLGIWASRHPKLEHAALTLASIIQTIPSLALLAAMVFAWGTIGWIPALIALILYSVLPILRNTITGLQGVDADCIEAARGVGMTERQMLWWVQLPLAAPTILAGVRTASVWVVGLATIAQPVGATSLGNYIFVGLQTSNSLALLFGCFFSAVLALLLASVGLYGVIAYSVNLRIREFGIRMALGAETGDVLRLVLTRAGKVTVIGLGGGLAGALALAQLMASVLYGVSPFDVLAYATAFVALSAVALAATLLPARRATRVNPVVALRNE